MNTSRLVISIEKMSQEFKSGTITSPKVAGFFLNRL